MKRFFFAASVLALCTSSFAQSFVSSPKGQLSTEGARYAYFLGRYSSARFMFFDGEFRNQLMIMKEIAYRMDFRAHRTSTAQGRSWKNVTVKMSECDFSKLNPVSSVFSQNSTTTPTTVFNSSVTWASHTGNPTSSPAPWTIKFPFRTSYIHVGNKDILADYDFSGGTMANGSLWTSSRGYAYYLDAVNSSSYAFNRQTYHGPYSTRGGCVDSNASRTYGAYNYFYFYHYGPNYPTASFKNKFRIYQYSYYTAPGLPVLHAIALSGSATGTNFPGVTCQKLFINPATILTLTGATARTSTSASAGPIYPTGTANGLIPAISSAAGLGLWAQAVWADTRSKAMKFTRAVSTTIPTLVPAPKHSVVYQYQDLLKSWYGFGPYGTYIHNPTRRYTK